ncbi:MAG: M6 family metalloprotease domain-containing protein [Prevotella sp.]|jgi:immune inhibitor A
MMKKLLFFLCLFMTATYVQAVKVNPEPAVITQSDGTQLTVYAYGDADCHWYTTADGVLLVHVGTNYYVANVTADGALQSSKMLAHEPALRTVAEQRIIKAQDRQLFTKSMDTKLDALRRISIANNSYFPHEGSPKALVILVNFADSTFSLADPVKSFNQYLNSTLENGSLENFGNRENRNYGSVRSYFNDMSFGQFTPQFDIVGPVTMPQGLAYYGSNNGSIIDAKVGEMMSAACQQVDDEVNFADYDSDGNGYVDLVYFIYAGYSESFSQNSSDCIWPRSGTMTIGTFDGKQVSRYGVNNELNGYPGAFSKAPYKRINGIGLFCHEFSHTMGLPDFYPINTSAQVDNQAMEYWDLMDGGEYLDGGYCPTPYTPWEREVMGWMSLETLSEAQYVEMQPVQNGGKAYKVLADNGEYLILENIQNHGWNLRQYGHGLLVYRIDYPYTTVNFNDNPNNTKGKPAVTIVPADGLLISSYSIDGETVTRDQYNSSHAGDPFPGTSGVTELTSVTLNESTLTTAPLYDIQEDTEAGIISFAFIDRQYSSIQGITEKAQTNGNVYTLDGRYVGTSLNGLAKGIYVKDGKKIVIK